MPQSNWKAALDITEQLEGQQITTGQGVTIAFGCFDTAQEASQQVDALGGFEVDVTCTEQGDWGITIA